MGDSGDSIDLRIRKALRDSIRNCRDCGLCTAGGNGPVPFAGPATGIVVLGEAPGAEEDRFGRPFIGPAGQLLRRYLAKVGIDPREVGWVNVVSCYPGRAPSDAEIAACRVNCDSQLAFLRPKFVLAVGNVALQWFKPDMKVGDAHGRWWWSAKFQCWVMACYHPAAVLRNGNLEGVVLRDLEVFKFFTLGVWEPWEEWLLVGSVWEDGEKVEYRVKGGKDGKGKGKGKGGRISGQQLQLG